mmetsp:Transcript_10361/g.28834  ORF Transcript_10361/g.28834 Transcript_10361/m.28834 type:complete len:288 (+) Transcript_10361:791-1654(+)
MEAIRLVAVPWCGRAAGHLAHSSAGHRWCALRAGLGCAAMLVGNEAALGVVLASLALQRAMGIKVVLGVALASPACNHLCLQCPLCLEGVGPGVRAIRKGHQAARFNNSTHSWAHLCIGLTVSLTPGTSARKVQAGSFTRWRLLAGNPWPSVCHTRIELRMAGFSRVGEIRRQRFGGVASWTCYVCGTDLMLQRHKNWCVWREGFACPCVRTTSPLSHGRVLSCAPRQCETFTFGTQYCPNTPNFQNIGVTECVPKHLHALTIFGDSTKHDGDLRCLQQSAQAAAAH